MNTMERMTKVIERTLAMFVVRSVRKAVQNNEDRLPWVRVSPRAPCSFSSVYCDVDTQMTCCECLGSLSHSLRTSFYPGKCVCVGGGDYRLLLVILAGCDVTVVPPQLQHTAISLMYD